MFLKNIISKNNVGIYYLIETITQLFVLVSSIILQNTEIAYMMSWLHAFNTDSGFV